MNDGLLQVILERLEADDLGPSTEALVLAACEGDAELHGLLSGTALSPSADRRTVSGKAIPGVFLKEILVEGFRGIGPEATLQPAVGAGLTLVVGRNGSGKSSFAEALEMLLTGANQRWANRPTIWQEGWRNLHHEGRHESVRHFWSRGPPPL